MRKYRGKRVDNGEWVYGYLIGADVIVGEIVEFTDEYFCTEFWYRVDPETVGQYTGTNDYNGNGDELFEGDIVKGHVLNISTGRYRGFVGKIVFRSSRFVVDGIGKYEGNYNETLYSSFLGIGNIHDNPELAEVGA